MTRYKIEILHYVAKANLQKNFHVFTFFIEAVLKITTKRLLTVYVQLAYRRKMLTKITVT